jgi:tetratricopeptide (TPR) repeat protein
MSEGVTPVTGISRKVEADQLCNQGRELERKGQPGEAITAYRAALAVQDDHYLSHFFLSLLLERLDRLEEARIEALCARTINPDATSSENHVSILSRLAFRYAEALDADHLLDVWGDLCRFGATEQAASIEQFIRDTFSSSEDSISRIAAVYLECGRHPEVISLCSDAIDSGIALSHVLYRHRAASRIALGEVENAYRDYIEGVEREPGTLARWDAVLALGEESEQRCQALIEFSARLIDEQGERPALLCAHANLSLAAQLYDQATAAFERLTHTPAFAKYAHHRIAQIAYRREDYGRAVRHRLMGIARILQERLGNRLRNLTARAAHP